MTRILIADDDADARELLRFTLDSLGHEVTEAVNGLEALKAALAHPPEMIISDILMPEMDGFELCREIKTDGAFNDVPVVFYTATYVDAEDERLALDLGGSGFIRKGADSAEMVAVLKELLRRFSQGELPVPDLNEEALAELNRRHDGSVARKLSKKIVELQGERKLHRESLEMVQAVFDAAVSAIIAIDGQGRVIAWNNAATTMFGYEAGEALGKDLHTLVMPAWYQDEAAKGLAHFFATGEGRIIRKIVELTARRKDGSEFPAAISASGFRRDGQWCAAATVRDITDRKRMEAEREQAALELKSALTGTIEAIAVALTQRDPYTAGHQKNVAILCAAIGAELELPDETIEGLKLAATIHDIGKISVPADLLSKPTKLREIEFQLIKEHAQAGYEIVKGVAFPWPIAKMILQHHERLDGSGYPLGISGDAILLESRILAVADVVEAISSHRPYRPTMGMDAALDEIVRGRGKLFDPAVVDACVRLIREKSFSFD